MIPKPSLGERYPPFHVFCRRRIVIHLYIWYGVAQQGSSIGFMHLRMAMSIILNWGSNGDFVVIANYFRLRSEIQIASRRPLHMQELSLCVLGVGSCS